MCIISLKKIKCELGFVSHHNFLTCVKVPVLALLSLTLILCFLCWTLKYYSFSTSADASFDTSSRCVNIIQKSKKKPASVLPALVKAFGPTIVFGAFLNLIQDLLTFASPQILR